MNVYVLLGAAIIFEVIGTMLLPAAKFYQGIA